MGRKLNKEYCGRLIQMLVSVIVMGVAIYFLLSAKVGSDPCSTLNNALSKRLGLSFGTCQLLTNLLLLTIVVLRDRTLLGPGTFCNMILVGYSADLTGFLVEKTVGVLQFEGVTEKVLVVIPALFVFALSAGFYMNSNLGTAPYDAFGILCQKFLTKLTGHKFRFRTVRMGYDFMMAVVAYLLGGTIGIVTVGVILTLGPAVDLVGTFLKKIKKEK